MFIPRSVVGRLLMASFTLLLGGGPLLLADHKDDDQKIKAAVSIAINTPKLAESAELSGKMSCQFTWPAGSPNKDKKTVRLGGPVLALRFEPASLARDFYQVDVQGMPNGTVEIGRTYEVNFTVRGSEELRRLAEVAKKKVALFKPGKNRVQAMVVSSANQQERYAGTIDVVGHFTSDWLTFELTPAPESVLSAKDLLAAFDKEAAPLEGLIAEYYAYRGFHLTDLAKFFPKPNGPLVIQGTSPAPFFISAKPDDAIEVRADIAPPGAYNFKSPRENFLIPGLGKGQFQFRPPSKPGVWPVTCDTARRTWGWVLVLPNP